jgi:hypothetical protein
MWEAVSNCLIFLSNPSIWGPGSSLACLAFSAAMFSSNVCGSATLHATTSLLRVLTVGFASQILICRCPAVGSVVTIQMRATVNLSLAIEVGNKAWVACWNDVALPESIPGFQTPTGRKPVTEPGSAALAWQVRQGRLLAFLSKEFDADQLSRSPNNCATMSGAVQLSAM